MLRKPPRTAANTVLSLPTADQNVRWAGGDGQDALLGGGPAGRPTRLRRGVSTAQGWRQFEFNSHRFGWI